MAANELTQKIVLRIGRFKILIFLAGLGVAVLLFFYAKRQQPSYTSRATVFPLTASNDNSAANSALSSILGISEAPKSFSQEASINIVELALSRRTREAVAMTKLDSMNNRTIAELVIANYNRTRGMFAPPLQIPTAPKDLASLGGELLRGGFVAKINKNGILEISYTCTDPALVGPISYVFIDRISSFYKDLKIRKAQLDYNFTVRKIDSLQAVLNIYDRRAIHMNNTTLFVPADKIQYIIPKENLASDKERVMRQRDASANNREEALWRLQKVTPIIETLDKPDPPYQVKRASTMMYTLIGFLLGAFLATGAVVSGILYKYLKQQAGSAIFGDPVLDNTTSTTI
jgi:uncharacterized protein involved in exopolysaccharide biosynthesis